MADLRKGAVVVTLGSCAMRGKQPPRASDDDRLKVEVVRGGAHLRISLTNEHGEENASLVVSEHNAWALIGILSIFVGLRLPGSIGKRIRIM